MGKVTEAGACEQAAFGFTGSDVEFASLMCVTSGSGLYQGATGGHTREATLTVKAGGTLYFTKFGILAYYSPGNLVDPADSLGIKGIKYAGTTKPVGIAVDVGDSAIWKVRSTTNCVNGMTDMYNGVTLTSNVCDGFTMCVCESANYHVLESPTASNGGTCTQYSLTTCPSGSWGDAITTRCVLCDSSAGKASRPGSGHVTEATACIQSLFGITGSGVDFDSVDPVNCITDTSDSSGNLQPNQAASITARVGGSLYIHLFAFDTGVFIQLI